MSARKAGATMKAQKKRKKNHKKENHRRRNKLSLVKMAHVPIKGPRCNETLFIFIDQNKTIYADDFEHVQPTGAVVFFAGVACQIFFKKGNPVFTQSPYSLVQGINPPLKPEAPGSAEYAIGNYPLLVPETGPIIVVP